MEIWYFETSAVYFFVNQLSIEDALATKHLQLNKGRDWRLSPATLYEILMTSDAGQREKIIYLCQHLFSRELMPSFAELIIPYIRQGMPKLESPRKLISASSIANTWRDLVDNKDKTFIFDHEQLKIRFKIVQTLTKNVHDLIKHDDLLVTADKSFVGLDVTLGSLVKELPFIKAGEPTSKEELLRYKVSLYFILIILCAELDFENEPITDFWSELGISSIKERVYYVLKELPALVHRGPFIMMAYMTGSQASGKYPRGVLLDSFHSVYMTYVDKILTTDGHFVGLGSIIPEPILRDRIHHISDADITRHNINQFGVGDA